MLDILCLITIVINYCSQNRNYQNRNCENQVTVHVQSMWLIRWMLTVYMLGACGNIALLAIPV